MTWGRVFVSGKSEPQGSTKPFAGRDGKIHTTTANKKLYPWRESIRAVVRAEVGNVIQIPEAPVFLLLEFVLPRRVNEPKTFTPAHTRKPDLDKLERSILDSLTGLVYTGDQQVSAIWAEKRTADREEQPGVWIHWTDLPNRTEQDNSVRLRIAADDWISMGMRA